MVARVRERARRSLDVLALVLLREVEEMVRSRMSPSAAVQKKMPASIWECVSDASEGDIWSSMIMRMTKNRMERRWRYGGICVHVDFAGRLEGRDRVIAIGLRMLIMRELKSVEYIKDSPSTGLTLCRKSGMYTAC